MEFRESYKTNKNTGLPHNVLSYLLKSTLGKEDMEFKSSRLQVQGLVIRRWLNRLWRQTPFTPVTYKGAKENVKVKINTDNIKISFSAFTWC